MCASVSQRSFFKLLIELLCFCHESVWSLVPNITLMSCIRDVVIIIKGAFQLLLMFFFYIRLLIYFFGIRHMI